MIGGAVTTSREGSLVITTSRYYSFLLIVFLICTMTTMNVLAPRRVYLSVLETGDGDLGRQIGYLLLFAAAVIPILFTSARSLFHAVPFGLLALLLWCGVTVFWSPVPDIALRRYGLTVVLTVTALTIVSQLELEPGLRLIGRVLMGLVAASLVAALLTPDLAFHQLGDSESGTIGSLRGIFYHKNTFGTVAALSVLFALIECLRRPRSPVWNWSLLTTCAAALALSGSKTALILVAAIGAFMWLSVAVLRDRALAPATAVGITILAVAALIPLSLYLPDLVDQPELFSGRGLIWSLTYKLAMEDPLFGSGFQSIFQVGAPSAMREMYNSRFIQTLSHAHNAYLELFASIGLIGLALAFVAVIAAPLRNLSRLDIARPTRTLAISLILFVSFHALLESGLVDRDRPTWMLIVLMVGLLFTATRRSRKTAGSA